MVPLTRSGRFLVTLSACAARLAEVSTTESAQQPPQTARPAQAAPPAAHTMTLDSGAGMIFHQIKPGRRADFDWVMGRRDIYMRVSGPFGRASTRVNLPPISEYGT